MIEASLRPYPGTIRICKTRGEYQREHKYLFGHRDKTLTAAKRGRMVGRWDDKTQWPFYIVRADSTPTLAHEIAHVILHVFELAGIDPRAADGEPFCYMLSQLLLDAKGEK